MIRELREFYNYRELLSNLVQRDLKLRYRSSVLGFLWSLVNPLLLMVVFTVVFTIMIPNLSIPKFPVFVLSSLLPWNTFSTSVLGALNSIVQGGYLIKKVYFPPEVLSTASVLSSFTNFILSLPALFLLMILFDVPFTIYLLYLPLIMIVHLAFTLGVSLFLATVNVFYRDIGHIMEVVMQAWFFLTPIFYSLNIVPETKVLLGISIPVRRLVYYMNPMASIIESYRSVLYGYVNGSPPSAPALDFFARTAITALLVLTLGYWVFTRYRHRFGEEI